MELCLIWCYLVPDVLAPILSLQVEYQDLKKDQLYNPYSEVLVLTGHISTVHQIELIYENRQAPLLSVLLCGLNTLVSNRLY